MLNESPLLLPLWEENCWCLSLLLFTFSYLPCILPEVLDLFLKLLTNFQNSQQGLLPQRALHPTQEASFCDPNEADSEKRENLSIDGLSLRGFFFLVLRKKNQFWWQHRHLDMMAGRNAEARDLCLFCCQPVWSGVWEACWWSGFFFWQWLSV